MNDFIFYPKYISVKPCQVEVKVILRLECCYVEDVFRGCKYVPVPYIN